MVLHSQLCEKKKKKLDVIATPELFKLEGLKEVSLNELSVNIGTKRVGSLQRKIYFAVCTVPVLVMTGRCRK